MPHDSATGNITYSEGHESAHWKQLFWKSILANLTKKTKAKASRKITAFNTNPYLQQFSFLRDVL